MGILRSRNNYVCPFCFNDVNLAKIHYACTNPLCTKTFLDSVDGKRFRSEFKEGEDLRHGGTGRGRGKMDVPRGTG